MKTIGVAKNEEEIARFYNEGKVWIDRQVNGEDLFDLHTQEAEEQRLTDHFLSNIENILHNGTQLILNRVYDSIGYNSIDDYILRQNFLGALLKPKFSEVTTTLMMSQTMTGSITAISNPVFKPVVQNVTLNLSNGTLSYGALNSAGKGVTFPAIGNGGLRSITSQPTTLIHNQTSAATLQFGSITVDGETKNNITVAGLNIKPGHRYNLILTLNTCTEAVNGLNGFNWEFEAATKRIGGITYTGINFNPDYAVDIFI